jgi:hypothetical protein
MSACDMKEKHWQDTPFTNCIAGVAASGGGWELVRIGLIVCRCIL